MAQKQYEALVGIDHADGRDEPGSIYTGPRRAIQWLLASGAIRESQDDTTEAGEEE